MPVNQEIEHIKTHFKQQKVSVIKYNYAVDDSVQNSSCFEAFLQLSEDEEFLMITNKKPDEDPEYILEADPEAVRNAQEAY